MILYFNGDSFVAGSELADDLLPDYPGLKPFVHPFTVNIKGAHWKWYGKVQGEREKRVLELAKIERERCFAGKVAKATKFITYNKGLGGSSMDRIVRTSVTDLIEIKKNNPNIPIQAFIGITNPHRFELGIHNTTDNEYWKCYNLLNILERSATAEILDSIIKYKITYETNYHNLINFYKNVIFLNEFCKVNAIAINWIACRHNHQDLAYWERDFTDYKDLIILKEYANLTFAVDMLKIAYSLGNENIHCPGGHFGQPVHDFVAKEIIKIINGINRNKESSI